jgi:hypothetical protein
MAANLAALRAALTRVGFTAPVAINITDVENIDSLEELSYLAPKMSRLSARHSAAQEDWLTTRMRA